LRKALKTLSRTTCEVLYLRLGEGCSQQEIAERLKLSPKSVGSMASVGLKKLTREFEKLSGNAEPRRDKP
jgi:DNA-directed RNA polymerase specialized sigma24 family protein